MSDKKKSARSTSARGSNLLSDEERAAMKETLKERRRALSGQADGESDVLAKIAEMAEPDRGMARRLHNIIKASAPTLSPKTWYGMPAYAKDGKVVCFFQSGQKFKSRYATLGFQDAGNLDDGAIWPSSFALKEAQRRRRGKDRQPCQESSELRAQAHDSGAGMPIAVALLAFRRLATHGPWAERAQMLCGIAARGAVPPYSLSAGVRQSRSANRCHP